MSKYNNYFLSYLHNKPSGPWNRCDYCGRFIAYSEFKNFSAIRIMVIPDSEVSDETYQTYHIKCKQLIY